jgi:predicted Zn finger-like uncharacterized protein
MPIRITCPSCSATLSVKDELAGRAVKCPKCGGVIPGSQSAAGGTPPAAKAPAPPPGPTPSAPKMPAMPAAKPAPAPVPAPPEPEPESESESSPFGNLDAPAASKGKSTGKSAPAPEDEDDKPRKKRRDERDEDADDKPRKKRRDEDEDEVPRKKGRDRDDEGDEDRGSKGPRGNKGARDEAGDGPGEKAKKGKRDLDDDDDDDRPRKRKRRDDDDDDRPTKGKKKGGGGGKVILIICAVLLLICGGGGFAVYYFIISAADSAQKGLEEFAENAKKDAKNAKKEIDLTGPAIEVSGETLGKEYKDDATAADAKYKGKILVVEAKLAAIDLQADGSMNIRLLGFGVGVVGGNQIRCAVPAADQNKVFNCSMNQSIKYRGKCDGLTLNAAFVELLGGKIESTGPDPAVNVSAADLIKAYTAGDKTADEKYKDKPITLTAATVESKTDDAVYFTAGLKGKAQMKIKVSYPFDFKKQFDALKVGDRVKVKGECGGLSFDKTYLYMNSAWIAP